MRLPARDLADAEGEGLAAQVGRLARAHDHAGVGHREPQDGDDLAEVDVAHRVRRLAGHVRAAGRLEARHADGVRAHAEGALELAHVLHEREDLEAPVVQAEEDADADVVDAGLHGAVHPGHAPVVIPLLAADVHCSVRGAMVRLLEELEGADATALERLEVRHREGSHVDIDAADLAVAALDLVDRGDRIEHVAEALLGVRLSGDQQDALVALVDEQLGLVADLRLRERPALELLVAHAEGAVQAVVVAHVADIERREQDEARAVDRVLDVARRSEQLAEQLGVAHRAEDGHVLHVQALELGRLGEDLAHAAGILGGGRLRASPMAASSMNAPVSTTLVLM